MTTFWTRTPDGAVSVVVVAPVVTGGSVVWPDVGVGVTPSLVTT